MSWSSRRLPFYAPYLSDSRFPSDGTIPDDLDNFQPRFGLAWDVSGDASTVLRLNAGAYHSRIPILVFAQSVTTNGAFQQIFFRSSFGLPGKGPPAIGDLIDGSTTPPFLPDIHVTAKDLELPRTWSFAGRDRARGDARRGREPVVPARADGPPLSVSSTATTRPSVRPSGLAPTRAAAESAR